MKNNFGKKLGISFGVIVGSTIIAGGAFYYFSNQITAQAAKITVEHQAVDANNSALTNLAVLESDVPKAAAYESALNGLLPDQYGTVAFPSWIAHAGTQYGVTAVATLAGSGMAASQPISVGPGTVGFSLTASGPLGSIAKFLKYIDSAPGYLFNLDSFSYTYDSSGEHLSAQGTLFFRQ